MTLVEFDVAVVGGGIAGMSVAGELAGTRRVAVLEQEPQFAYHASGRSAAAFLESYGSPAIRALTRASRPLFADGLLRPRRLLWVADAAGRDTLEALVAAEPLVRALTPEQARAYCPVLRPQWLAAAAAEDGAQDIDVAGLFEHYRHLALAGGATLLASAGVLEGAYVNGGWTLRTPAGDVRAAVVVNAAGAWADVVAERCGVAPAGLTPLRRTVAIVTSPAVDRTWPLVCDIGDAFYFRPEGVDLLLSPADETLVEPGDARPQTEDVALALEHANEATTLGLRHVKTAWAGLRTFAPDRNPVVGPDPTQPGFFWVAGQGGYGMQTAPAMAKLAAALVRDEPPPPAHFADHDLAVMIDAMASGRVALD
jgi:D-arginine dehydrogenase